MSRAARYALMLLAPLVWARAEPDYDVLLTRALRYGDTPERRAEKAEARAELEALGAAALRAMMDRAHFENIMLQVVALEFVQHHVSAEDGAPILRDSLNSPHEQTRRIAAFMLGFYPRDEASIPVLIEMTKRERERNAAIRTLGIWRVEDARPIARALLRAEQERTRIAAVNALNRIGNPEDIPALFDALGDEAILVRNTAARALLAHGKPAARALRAALPNAEGVRLRQIIRLLGALEDRAARRPLARLLRNANPDVRADAAWALARIAGKPSAEWRLEEPFF